MQIKKIDYVKEFRSKNTDRISTFLEENGLSKNPEAIKPINYGSKEIIRVTLDLAAANAFHNNLDDILANEIVERVAYYVNTFPFARLVVESIDIEEDINLSIIPNLILEAINDNYYNDAIATEIENMDNEALKAILVYLLTEKKDDLSRKYNIPIILGILKRNIIPNYLVFSFMSSTICLSLEELYFIKH